MENVDVDKFENILNSSSDERTISRFIKKNPWLLYWTICRLGGNNRFMFSEFPLGSDHKVDFLILNSTSFVWEAIFVELESVKSNFFNKNRTPNKKLVIATQQIAEWKRYIDINKENIRKEFCKRTAKKDLLGYAEPSDNPSNLIDPRTFLKFEFYIVMGRRTDVKSENIYYIGSYTDNYGVSLITYDRLLDLAKRRYLSDYFLSKGKDKKV
jgi:hypothetical protein